MEVEGNKMDADSVVKFDLDNKEINGLGIVKTIESSSLLKVRVTLERSSILSVLNILNNSPVMHQIKTMERLSSSRSSVLQSLDNSSVTQLINAMKKLSSSRLSVLQSIINSPVMQQIKAMEALSSSKLNSFNNSPSIRQINIIEKSISESLKFRNSSLSTLLKAITSSKVSTYSDLLEKVVSANAGPLSFGEAYQEVVESVNSIPISEDFDRFKIQLDNKISKAPAGALSAEFYLSLIFAFILFYISQASTIESEKKLLDRMDILETTVSSQLHNLNRYERGSTFYLVERGVNLRVKPTTNSQVVSVLYPNMKVLLVERATKWIKIEYFDYKNNVYVSGWVYKKYLKMM